MIGKAASRIRPIPNRWLYQVWGSPNIHARQKWKIIWPLLQQWPQENLSVLDVGCGAGPWAIELASRRPGWKVTGIDLDGKAIKEGNAIRQKLGLNNLQLIETDYLDYHAEGQFDLVLSIASAHYPFEYGRGAELFEQFHNWLKPHSRLILYAPRRCTEIPYTHWMKGRRWYNVFTAEQINDLCAAHHLTPEHLSPRIGLLGSIAKEMYRSPSALKRITAYPFSWALLILDNWLAPTKHSCSLFWLLVARSPRRPVRKNGATTSISAAQAVPTAARDINNSTETSFELASRSGSGSIKTFP